MAVFPFFDPLPDERPGIGWDLLQQHRQQDHLNVPPSPQDGEPGAVPQPGSPGNAPGTLPLGRAKVAQAEPVVASDATFEGPPAPQTPSGGPQEPAQSVSGTPGTPEPNPFRASPEAPQAATEPNPFSDEQRPNAVQNALNAGNTWLSKALDLPLNAITGAMASIAGEYPDLLARYGTNEDQLRVATKNLVNRAFKAANVITADPYEHISKSIGEGTMMGLVTLASMGMAAPSLATAGSAQGANIIARTAGQMADDIIRNPAISAGSEIGSAIGGQIAVDKGQEHASTMGAVGGTAAGLAIPGGPMAKAARAVVGGVTGGAVGQAAPEFTANIVGSMAGGAVGAAGVRVARSAAERFQSVMSPEVPMDPLRPVYNHPEDVAAAARAGMMGQQRALEADFQRAMDNISTAPNSQASQAQAYRAVHRYEQAARRLVNSYWEQVPLDTHMYTNNLRANVQTMFNEITPLNQDQYPVGLMRRFLTIDPGIRMQGSDIMDQYDNTVPLREIYSFRSTLRREAQDAMAGAPLAGRSANHPLARNLNRIEDMILTEIGEQFPNDVRIQRARDMSRWENETFRSGPIGDMLARTGTGAQRNDPELAVSRLLEQHRGLRSTNDLARPQVTQAVDQSLRDIWREQIDAIPESPSRMAQVERSTRVMENSLRGLTPVATDLQQAFTTFSRVRNDMDDLSRSALARVSGHAFPERAVEQVVTGPNAVREMRQLVTASQGDPYALRGLKAMTIDSLQKQANLSPTNLQNLLRTDKVANLLPEVLTPQEITRFHRIADAAAAIERSGTRFKPTPMNLLGLTAGGSLAAAGDPTLGAIAITGSAANFIGRVVGAWFGRQLGHITHGGGTLQIPGAVAQYGAKAAERLVGMENPDYFLRMAVIDPWWEKRLMSKVPTSANELRQFESALQKKISAMETVRAQTFSGSDDDEP